MSSPSKYKLIITEPAEGDLYSIAAYTRNQWGEEQARKYNNQIFLTLSEILDDPINSRKRYGVPDVIKGRKSGQHVIFYRIVEREIFIMRVLHQSMDHGRHLQ